MPNAFIERGKQEICKHHNQYVLLEVNSSKLRLEEADIMHRVLQLVKDMAKKSLERDRASERYIEVVSRFLWPWRESWLLLLVGLLAILDYISTYTLLKLSGEMAIYEGGALASRALQIDGFRGLFLMNITAVSALSLAVVTTRFLYTKFGFE